jgi:hypothetical protein
VLNTVSSTSAKGENSEYQTGFVRWRVTENGFQDWTLDDVKLNANGELESDAATAIAGTDPYPVGTYNGGNYYNGGAFFVGDAVSPKVITTFDYHEAIASWNAFTPAGTWIEIQFRAQYGTRWSKWYVLGIWASDNSMIRRHSVNSQDDSDSRVAADTYISSNKEEATSTFQLKLRLFSADGASTPSVRNVSVAYSTSAPKAASPSNGNPGLWNTGLEVLKCSQMIYPNGGNVWCSPTSLSMVLSYWEGYTGSREPRVHTAVESVFDWIYDGHRNWPFNTVYAGTFGYEGYIVRFTSLAQAEAYIAAGILVIMSIAWGKGDLTGAAVDSSNGHLLVLVGFDSAGNPIINDPAAPTDDEVQRTYLRSELEPLWLEASGGTVYLIYPQGASVPALP